jgi:BlaI family transcriptional regulator, penicillinase repressor
MMLDKGLLHREVVERAHLYTPTESEEATQAVVLQGVVETAFRGNTSTLVLRALGNADASAAELAQIKALIEKIENR